MMLIDTNIIGESLKRDPDAGVKALFASAPDLALSVVTLEKMAYGSRMRARATGLAII